MRIRRLTLSSLLLSLLLPLPFSALEPAHTLPIGPEKRQAIFLRAESGEGLVAFVPEGKAGWRLNLYPMLGSVAAFAAADFDRDGSADLAVIKSSGEFATMPGNGQGGFDLKSNSRGALHGFVPIAVQVEDLNGDGNPDLALFDGKRRLDLKNDGFGNLESAAAAKAAPPIAAEALFADFYGRGAQDGIEVRRDRVLIHPSSGGSPVEINSRYVIRAAAVGNFSGNDGMELALISFGERPRLQIISAASGATITNDAASFSSIVPEMPTANLNVTAFCCGSYNPNPANINVNDTITWSLGVNFHTATQTTGNNCITLAGGFNSGLRASGSWLSPPFTTAGTLFYKCNTGLHCSSGGMKGSIVVTAPATPGTIPATGTPVKVKKSATAGKLDLTWGASCSATAIASVIYEGMLSSFGSGTYSHTAMPSAGCSTAGTAASVIPAAGNTYYLVVAITASNEGSYGQDSSGAEIPVGISECLAQGLAGSC